MNVNKSTRFALYAVFELAKDAPSKLNVSQIANRYHVSEHHMSKVMQLLTRYEIVSASRGVGGGYQLAIPANQLTVMQIIQIMEPRFFTQSCKMKSRNEDCIKEGQCTIYDLFNEVSQQVMSTFSAVTISSLVKRSEKNRKNPTSLLMMESI